MGKFEDTVELKKFDIEPCDRKASKIESANERTSKFKFVGKKEELEKIVSVKHNYELWDAIYSFGCQINKTLFLVNENNSVFIQSCDSTADMGDREYWYDDGMLVFLYKLISLGLVEVVK